MKYRHYAPKADVHVWWGDDGETVAAMARFLALHPDEKVAVVSRRPLAGAANAWTPSPGESYVVALSRHLYGLLREFDHAHCPLILIQGVPPVDEGAALMNRLEKASGGRVTRV